MKPKQLQEIRILTNKAIAEGLTKHERKRLIQMRREIEHDEHNRRPNGSMHQSNQALRIQRQTASSSQMNNNQVQSHLKRRLPQIRQPSLKNHSLSNDSLNSMDHSFPQSTTAEKNPVMTSTKQEHKTLHTHPCIYKIKDILKEIQTLEFIRRNTSLPPHLHLRFCMLMDQLFKINYEDDYDAEKKEYSRPEPDHNSFPDVDLSDKKTCLNSMQPDHRATNQAGRVQRTSFTSISSMQELCTPKNVESSLHLNAIDKNALSLNDEDTLPYLTPSLIAELPLDCYEEDTFEMVDSLSIPSLDCVDIETHENLLIMNKAYFQKSPTQSSKLILDNGPHEKKDTSK